MDPRHNGLSVYDATRKERHPLPHYTRTICGLLIPTMDLLAHYVAAQPYCPVCFPKEA